MKTGSKKLSRTTQDWRDKNTGYPSGIFKQKSGSTNTTNTAIAPPPSLITVGYHTLITLVLVTMAQLLLVYTMLMPFSRTATIALLVVTAISVLFTLKTLLILIRSLGWWSAATKGQKKTGRDKQTENGGMGW